MGAAEERFIAGAGALGVTVDVRTFPDGTRTAHDAAVAVGCDVGAIVKSLVFIADGAAVLALTSGANRVDECRLAAALTATEVRKATADEARDATGYTIGGTPPFAHTGTGVAQVLCDPALLEHAQVWAAAGGPTTVFPLPPGQLVSITGATVVDVTIARPRTRERVRALVLTRADEGPGEVSIRAEVRELATSDLPAGEVTIDVSHSSLNYKDALIVTGHAGLVRDYPHVPGIDLAGTVSASTDPKVPVGSDVLVTGCWLGERHWGGMATHARVPADWVVQRPDGMDAARAMALGTAGFTAQLAVDALVRGGLTPTAGPVLVTGATGGVGSIAVHLLARAGFEVVASTGRDDAHELLHDLGARDIVTRTEVAAAAQRPLASARWAGVIDVAGGTTLAGALAATAPHGIVAACGLAADAALTTSVMPFIVRGVTLVGIDSVLHPMSARAEVWARLHGTVDADLLASITTIITLEQVVERATTLLRDGGRGRTLIDVR
jgi:acrylyl-CoA reductase (NADPH)